MAVPTATRAMSYTVIGRIVAALVGGYVFCWGFIALGVACLFALGMAFHDAESLSSMIAFLLYIGACLWAFSARSLLRVWAVLAGGGALMAVIASLMQSMMVH